MLDDGFAPTQRALALRNPTRYRVSHSTGPGTRPAECLVDTTSGQRFESPVRRPMSGARERTARIACRLFRAHRLEPSPQDLRVGTFRMSAKKRLDCRFFRFVSSERPQRADPSELGFLRQRTFVFAQITVEGGEGAGGIVELGEKEPPERDQRGAPFRAVGIARVGRAVSV